MAASPGSSAPSPQRTLQLRMPWDREGTRSSRPYSRPPAYPPTASPGCCQRGQKLVPSHRSVRLFVDQMPPLRVGPARGLAGRLLDLPRVYRESRRPATRGVLPRRAPRRPNLGGYSAPKKRTRSQTRSAGRRPPATGIDSRPGRAPRTPETARSTALPARQDAPGELCLQWASGVGAPATAWG